MRLKKKSLIWCSSSFLNLETDISHWFYKIHGHYLLKHCLFHIVSLISSCHSYLLICQTFTLHPLCLLTLFILFTSVSLHSIHICFSFLTILFGSLSNRPDVFWCLLYPHHTFNPLIHFFKYFYINWIHTDGISIICFLCRSDFVIYDISWISLMVAYFFMSLVNFDPKIIVLKTLFVIILWGIVVCFYQVCGLSHEINSWL